MSKNVQKRLYNYDSNSLKADFKEGLSNTEMYVGNSNALVNFTDPTFYCFHI